MFIATPTIIDVQEEIKLNSNWSGSLYSSWETDKNKSYIEPYIGLSFFPYINLKNEEIIKLFIGYEIKSLNKNLNVDDLLNKRNEWNLSWGFNINGKVKEGCFKIDSDKKNFHNLISKQRAFVNKKKQILLNKKCLNQNYWNEIKIWWSPTKNNEDFLDKSGNLTIRFYIPNNLNKKIDLTNKTKLNIKNTYFYLIKTKLNEKTIINDIFSKEFLFNSNLKKEYYDNLSFNSLFYLDYLNFSINIDNFKNFIILFSFDLIWEEMRKFKNNLNLNINPKIETELINLLKKIKLPTKIIDKNKNKKKYILTYKDKTINIPFYSIKQEVLLTKKYIGNIKTKDLIYIFNTNFDFDFDLFKLNLVLTKKILIKNNTFNKKLYINTNFDFDYQDKIFEIKIIIPCEFLYDLKNLNKREREVFFQKNIKELKYV